ncbi:hypothetical protein N7451_012862 [Penicillium sp. IBT 35674x]|nr:hypothetical protein N7451_012862 [Penicillium sp. IBT 35674x]
MRQVMTIADKGWTDIPTYLRIAPLFGTNGWKRYGSSFLLLAMFINILGAIMSPLQQLFFFFFTTTIKTPTWPLSVSGLLDTPDQWANVWAVPTYADDNLIVVLTRSTLASANNQQQESQIWQSANVTCLQTKRYEEIPKSCSSGGVTFANISQLEHPFLAQLPSGYSTGLLQQFIPRINSTAQYQNIPANEFPNGCDQIDGAFYVHYYNVSYDEDSSWARKSTWGLEACMPANLTKSPWSATRDRQNSTEELYLNLTVIGYDIGTSPQSDTDSTYYRIILDTTAGYFELPNYANGEIPGPLLDKDHNGVRGNSCEREGEGTNRIYNHDKEYKAKREGQSIDTDASRPLETVVNKGPLLTIAMALFGEGSFVQTRQANPRTYAWSFPATNSTLDVPYAGSCVGLAPMSYLLAEDCGTILIEDGISSCIDNTSGGPNGSTVGNEIANWISNFNCGSGRLENAFTTAGFLANQAWMESNVGKVGMTLSISYNMGTDSQIPVISRAGLILVSILLGLYILIVVPLAVYAASTPRWTSNFNSFAMMRMGAAVADRMPLDLGCNTDKIDALDEVSGWVGDASNESDLPGKLGDNERIDRVKDKELR